MPKSSVVSNSHIAALADFPSPSRHPSWHTLHDLPERIGRWRQQLRLVRRRQAVEIFQQQRGSLPWVAALADRVNRPPQQVVACHLRRRAAPIWRADRPPPDNGLPARRALGRCPDGHRSACSPRWPRQPRSGPAPSASPSYRPTAILSHIGLPVRGESGGSSGAAHPRTARPTFPLASSCGDKSRRPAARARRH